MAKREKKEEKPQVPLGHPDRPPVRMGEPTRENPSGIESVDPEHAQNLGQLRGAGGPGAGGAVVLGGVGFAATKGGAEPLPTPDDHLHDKKYTGETATEGARTGENLGSSNEGAESAALTGEAPKEKEDTDESNRENAGGDENQ